MKLAPSQANVNFLREVAENLDRIGDQILQKAAQFATSAASCKSELTDGDEEGLETIISTVKTDATNAEEIARELSLEASQLADDLEQEVHVKVLRR